MGEFSWYLLKRCQDTQEPFQTHKRSRFATYSSCSCSIPQGIYDLNSPSVSHTRKDSRWKGSSWKCFFFGPTTGLQCSYYLGPDYRPLLEMSQVTQKLHFCHCIAGWKKDHFPSDIWTLWGSKLSRFSAKEEKMALPALSSPCYRSLPSL